MTCFLKLLSDDLLDVLHTRSLRGPVRPRVLGVLTATWGEWSVAPPMALGAGGSSSARWWRQRSAKPFYPLVFGGLWFTKHLYLDDQLVVEAGCRFSLESSLIMIMSRIRPLFIHLLLKIRKHRDELVFSSIVPCPWCSRCERQSFLNIFDVDVRNCRMLIRISCASRSGWPSWLWWWHRNSSSLMRPLRLWSGFF